MVDFLSKHRYDEALSNYPPGHWDKAEERWLYFERASAIAKAVAPHSADAVLEIGTRGISIVCGSDTLDYSDTHWEFNPTHDATIRHDARETPWPIRDKHYELLIALRVFQHLVPNQRSCFLEARRVARQIILVVPESYPRRLLHERETPSICREEFIKWNDGISPTLIEPLPGWLGTLYFWDRQSLQGTGNRDTEIHPRPTTPLSRFVDTPDGSAEALIQCLSSPDGEQMFEAIGKEHLFDRNWRAAFSVYALLYLSGHKHHAWLCHRLARRVENQDTFDALFENERHKARIREHLAQRYGREIRSIETSPGKLGYIGVASYRHRITFSNRANCERSLPDALDLHEKVFDRTDEKNAILEGLLFESLPSSSLFAPTFHGTIKVGEFTSMLHEFIDGAHEFDSTVWYDLESRLLHEYWSIAPPDALLNHPIVDLAFPQRVLEGILHESALEKMGRHIEPQAFSTLTSFLIGNATRLVELLNSMPKFIFHRDLHEANVLLDSARNPKVIDWEQWAIAPIGFGWAPMVREGAVPRIDMPQLRKARALPAAIREDDIMLMAAIWGCFNAIEAQDFQLGAIWLARLPGFYRLHAGAS